MGAKIQPVLAWLKALGTILMVVSDAGQRIASAADAANKASS